MPDVRSGDRVAGPAGSWSSDGFQPAFWGAKRAMAAASERAYGRHGVRAGQQFVLMALWERDGQSPGELAKLLGLSTPTVTRTTTRMEAAGLVQRRARAADARVVEIWLTRRGSELQVVMDEEMRALSERALRSLSAADRAAFIDYLRQLRENLENL